MNNKLTLLAIVVLFSLPPIAAYLLYFTYLPLGSSNKGNLISPVIMLPEIAVNKNPIAAQWTLFMWLKTSCDKQCKKNIYLMRQVNSALGKNKNRVKRMVLVEKKLLTQNTQQFLQDYPKMLIINQQEDEFKILQQLFKQAVKTIEQRVFIIDPQGALMMYYSQDLDPDNLFK
ncbi:MAG: hypothetical protein QM479_02890 [Pseudomonadota bacterium]